ncbi:hypothetical protein [Amycolatopsis pigmentata]|uniref:Uncharacterized protein n=1 Tax=Amycolatopsis pigmentata TaxID=450801 RepID=A0ABW5FW54_9PSEU
MTTTNHAEAEMDGLQAREFHGSVTIDQEPHENGVRHSTAGETELADVRDRFIDPIGMGHARRVIGNRAVVVLQGVGSGRGTAALRLLVESGYEKVVRLDPARRLCTVKADDLREREGYLWESTGPGSTALTDSDFDHICRLIQDKKARLVIVVDRVVRLAAVSGAIIELSPPHPGTVAQAFIAASRPHDQDVAATLECGMAKYLNPGDPPRKAIRAAELAILVADGELAEEEASRELTTGESCPGGRVHR